MMGSMLEGVYSIKAAIELSINYKDTIQYNDLDSPFLYDKNFTQTLIKLDGATLSL